MSKDSGTVKVSRRGWSLCTSCFEIHVRGTRFGSPDFYPALVAPLMSLQLNDLPAELVVFITSLIDDASVLSFALTSKEHKQLFRVKVTSFQHQG